MKDDNAILQRVAEAISDGDPVDWQSESGAGEEIRTRLRGLRLVESVASAHRSLSQDPVEASGLATVVTLPPRTDTAVSGTWGLLELIEKLGEGGFGEVWRAREPKLDREVALKLRKQLPGIDDPFAGHFLDEARLLAKVDHDNVVPVYGADEHDGREGLWTKLVEGKTLEDEIRERGRFGDREAMLVGIDLCRALAAVHRVGLVHRDVKCPNVMRAAGGRIVLMDFGLVAAIPADGEASSSGALSGTPVAMAPEALDGGAPDVRSDLYSLGVLLYRLVTGEHPVEAGSFRELRDKHARGEMVHLLDRRADLSPAFVRVVERALAKDPAQRFPTAGAMERALSAAMEGSAWSGEAASQPEDATAQPTAAAPEAAESRRPEPAFRLPRWAWAAAASVGVALLLLTGAPGRIAEMLRGGGEGQAPAGPTGAVSQEGIVQPAGGGEEAAPSSADDALTSAAGSSSAAAGAQPSAVQVPAIPFEADASMFRVRRPDESGDVRLAQGGRVQPGDALFVEIDGNTSMHVYILNEDEAGEEWLLFPLKGSDVRNPLPAGKHRLPGNINGTRINWKVTSAGGTERFLLVASKGPLPALEAEIARYAEAGAGTPLKVTRGTMPTLRGVGGIEMGSPAPSDGASGNLAQLAAQMAALGTGAAGIHVQTFELSNPPR